MDERAGARSVWSRLKLKSNRVGWVIEYRGMGWSADRWPTLTAGTGEIVLIREQPFRLDAADYY